MQTEPYFGVDGDRVEIYFIYEFTIAYDIWKMSKCENFNLEM